MSDDRVAREKVLTVNRLKSLTSKDSVKVKFGKETFVYEKGKLIEYELQIPSDEYKVEFKKHQNKDAAK